MLAQRNRRRWLIGLRKLNTDRVTPDHSSPPSSPLTCTDVFLGTHTAPAPGSAGFGNSFPHMLVAQGIYDLAPSGEAATCGKSSRWRSSIVTGAGAAVFLQRARLGHQSADADPQRRTARQDAGRAHHEPTQLKWDQWTST